MKTKSSDSSPLRLVADIFDIQGNYDSINSKKSDMSLLTEINEKKVILEFNWIKDLDVMVSSFILDDIDQNILYNQLSHINNSLIIGHIKQTQNKSIIYKHTLPLSSSNKPEFIKKYLEDLLSEFNHLITVLLKKNSLSKFNDFKNNNKIVGHA